eukprot:CAMPEP_0115014074 /NCGR_PEP_ID=MMETSP0216-20121206/25826_1 /TAXON_ID=223996 /ORGANISM="Protocruzia adherens, Strain Boccale" /LENGTH=827 /DNA_ID=CAMNT_0002383673 /DNA_START=24 /DNA_END=2507 /DNA_ORIENTATION=-
MKPNKVVNLNPNLKGIPVSKANKRLSQSKTPTEDDQDSSRLLERRDSSHKLVARKVSNTSESGKRYHMGKATVETEDKQAATKPSGTTATVENDEIPKRSSLKKYSNPDRKLRMTRSNLKRLSFKLEKFDTEQKQARRKQRLLVCKQILCMIYGLFLFATIGFEFDLIKEELDEEFFIVELCILVALILSFVASAMIYGKMYMRTAVALLDIFLILISIVLLVLYVAPRTKEEHHLRILGISRLFRMLVVVAEVATILLIQNLYHCGQVEFDYQSPVGSVISILEQVYQVLPPTALRKNVDWCVNVIRDNKLYDIPLNHADLNETEIAWIKSYSNYEHGRRRPTVLHKRLTASPRKIADRRLGIRNDCSPTLSHFDFQMTVRDMLTLNFNSMDLHVKTKRKPLYYMMNLIFQTYNLFGSLKIHTLAFSNFVLKVQRGYVAKNPYHNSIHATDVVQSIHYIIHRCDFLRKGELSDAETCAMYIAAAIHDYKHPGVNNAYMVTTKTKLALRYNDQAVLENFHVAAAYKLLHHDSSNIFSGLNVETYNRVRAMIISMVLSTDMARHFSELNQFKARIQSQEFNMAGKDRQMVMNILLHACDIGTPAKPFEVSARWTKRIYEEFFRQGDRERQQNLEVGPLMDRFSVNVAKSQAGFIDAIAYPLFKQISTILPNMDDFLINLEDNRDCWMDHVEEYDVKLRDMRLHKEDIIEGGGMRMLSLLDGQDLEELNAVSDNDAENGAKNMLLQATVKDDKDDDDDDDSLSQDSDSATNSDLTNSDTTSNSDGNEDDEYEEEEANGDAVKKFASNENSGDQATQDEVYSITKAEKPE